MSAARSLNDASQDLEVSKDREFGHNFPASPLPFQAESRLTCGTLDHSGKGAVRIALSGVNARSCRRAVLGGNPTKHCNEGA